MPYRLIVQAPEPGEEVRALAEELSDLHYGISLMVEHAPELVPGESVDELRNAWEKSEESLIQLVQALDPTAVLMPPPPPPGYPPPQRPPLPAPPPRITHAHLMEHELAGAPGKAKRSWLRRLKDRFFGAWNPEPRTPDQIARAADAAVDWLECGETIVSSLPGWEKVEEIVSLVKQLIGHRWKQR